MNGAVDRYLHLTRTALPERARSGTVDWPVVNDHCFQRIVLDHVAGGVWYDHIARPAYRNLTPAQATQAADLARDILDGTADLHSMNRQSLIWRGKAPRP